MFISTHKEEMLRSTRKVDGRSPSHMSYNSYYSPVQIKEICRVGSGLYLKLHDILFVMSSGRIIKHGQVQPAIPP